MIKIETNYDAEKDTVHIDYSSNKSNTLEHLTLIKCLVQKILENDPIGLNEKDITKIIKTAIEEVIGKEDKNGKRSSK